MIKYGTVSGNTALHRLVDESNNGEVGVGVEKSSKWADTMGGVDDGEMLLVSIDDTPAQAPMTPPAAPSRRGSVAKRDASAANLSCEEPPPEKKAKVEAEGVGRGRGRKPAMAEAVLGKVGKSMCNAQIGRQRAAAARENRARESKVLNKTLQDLGLCLVEIPADGHCLFSAIGDQLRRSGDK